MATTDRFEIIAPLPSSAGFRRALAVDRAGPPRAVVLAFAPARVADDPVRIAALARDAEAAARVRHPNVVPVEGLETIGGAIAVVEPHRPGPSLRDLLDAGGRLPPDVAARIVADACAGLARVHALDPGDGRPLAHGALAAERLVLGEDGATALCGLGAGLGEDPAADVRALAAVLHECLTGEPPASPPRPLDSPGVPPALGAVVDLAIGATGGQPLRSAGVLGEAIAAALPLAAREAVAAYVEAILPAAEGERAALARLVARAIGEEAEADLGLELVEEGQTAETEPKPAIAAAMSIPVAAGPSEAVHPERSDAASAAERSGGTPTPTAAGTLEAVHPERSEAASAAERSRRTTATATPTAAGALEAVHPEPFDSAAFGRYAQDRLREAASAAERSRRTTPTSTPAPVASFTWIQTTPARAFDPVYPEPVVIPARAPAASPDTVSVFPAPAPAAPRRSRAPLALAACLLIGFGAGFAATRGGKFLPDLGRDEVAERQPAPPAAQPPSAPVRATDAAAEAPAPAPSPVPERDPAADERATPPAPARPASADAEPRKPARRVAAVSTGKGFIVVTAPAEAEVLLDGKRVGKGDVRREIDVGAHRVEVRLGEARVNERFTLVRGETWTYDVTPTSH